MKKMKLIHLVLINSGLIILLIVLFGVIRNSKKVDVPIDEREKIFGYWEINVYEVYKDNNLESSIDNYNQLSMDIDSKSFEICYKIDEEWNCRSHNYDIEGEDLIIYNFEVDKIESRFKYILDGDTLKLIDGDEKDYTLSTFFR